MRKYVISQFISGPISTGACIILTFPPLLVVPHGVAYEEFKAASDEAPPVMKISEGSIAIMFESSRPFTITEYAWTSNKKHEHEPKMWDNLVDNFSKHAKEVEEILAKKVKGMSV